MPRKIKLIFNPKANLGRAQELSAPLHSLFTELGGEDWSETNYPHHAQELATKAALDGYDLVIAVGGDGTVNGVLNGLLRSNATSLPTLGVIPAGSGNDFSFAVGIPPEPFSALRRVMSGTPQAVDIGKLTLDNDQELYWANAIGIGFDTIVTIYSRRVPIVHGFAVYLTAVLRTILFTYSPFHVQSIIDGIKHEGDYLMMVMCNGQREGGGFYVTPGGLANDGQLGYTFVHKVPRPRMLMTLPYFMKNEKSHLDYVDSNSFKSMQLSSDHPLLIHADGEILSGFDSTIKQLKIDILPNRLQMIW